MKLIESVSCPTTFSYSILSFLNFREATAAKILSSRCGRLDPTPNAVALDFPFPLEHVELGYGRGYIQTAQKNTISDYISLTNHVLDSYEGGQSIDKFKIDKFKIDILGSTFDYYSGDMGSYMALRFIKVKHMELDIEINEECDNHKLFPLIQTCPSMEELDIKFLWSSKATYESGELINNKFTGRKAKINKLKTVRLPGYRGSVAEFEFILHVVENATNLKDLIIVEDEDGHKNETTIQPQKFTSGAFEDL